MTANADSRYQMLLHVAAPILRRSATAELKSTYTASVSAVEASTPAATRGSSLIIFFTPPSRPAPAIASEPFHCRLRRTAIQIVSIFNARRVQIEARRFPKLSEEHYQWLRRQLQALP